MNSDRSQKDYFFDLPTSDDLTRLYKEKGEDALVWYAWRNLLRALPMLGVLSRKEIAYEKLSVSHYYQIIRLAIYLSFWPEKKKDKFDLSAAYEASEVLKSIHKGYAGNNSVEHDYETVEGQMAIDKSDIASFAQGSLEALADTLISTIELIKIIQADKKYSKTVIDLAVNTADRASYAELCLNALNVGIEGIHEPEFAEVNGGPETELLYNPSYIYASKFVDPIRDQASLCINESSARADFRWLEGQFNFTRHRFYNFSTYSAFDRNDDDHLSSDNLMDETVWNSRSLYSLDFISENGARKDVLDCTNALLNRLTLLDLKFLADDLRYLWRGYKLGKHASRYLEEFSTTETQNANSLKRLILENVKTDHMQAVRILLLGPGGSGKSSLADLLQGKSTKKPRYATMGIDLIDSNALDFKNTFPELSFSYKDLELFIWDFGGQAILHGLHSTLFHENCIYVLVVDSRHEQIPDDWLYQIQHLAGFQAKVLIVTNIYNGCLRNQNENRLIKQFPSLLSSDSFFYFSCVDQNNHSFKIFIHKLIEVSQNKQRQLLADTLSMKSIIEETFQDEIFIDIDNLEVLIEKYNESKETTEYLVDKLVQLGFLIPIDEDTTVYCLKADWLIYNAYRLINSSLLNESNGLATMRELRNVFNSDINLDDLKNLVSFLEDKGLCQKLVNGEGKYFFPESANTNEPNELIGQLNLGDSLTFRFDLQYMPLGYHKNLVRAAYIELLKK